MTDSEESESTALFLQSVEEQLSGRWIGLFAWFSRSLVLNIVVRSLCGRAVAGSSIDKHVLMSNRQSSRPVACEACMAAGFSCWVPVFIQLSPPKLDVPAMTATRAVM